MNERNGHAKERISKSRSPNFTTYRSCPPTKCASLDVDTADHFAELCALLENPEQALEQFSNAAGSPPRAAQDASGLQFEVEIDKSLQDLINWSNDNKKNKAVNSKLMQQLDVIIMPEDESKQTIVSLGVEEVSQLINIVKAKGSHQASGGISKENKESFNQVKYSSRRILPRSLANDPVLELCVGCESSEDECSHPDDEYSRQIIANNKQQVYTTPNHTFEDIKSKLPCISRSRTSSVSEKPGTACLCQHCGMVGVLVESQKRPAIPHTPNPKFTGNNNNVGIASPRHRKVDLRVRSKSETNLQLLKDLSKKVANLEGRLTEQEETAVRKDYFKFVIHRLITQYSNKINELKVAYQTKASNNMGTQYATKVPTPKERLWHRDDRSEQYGKKAPQSRKTSRGFDVKTVLMASDISAQNLPHDVHEETEKIKPSTLAIKDLCNMVYHKYCLKKGHAAGNEEKVIPEALLKGGAGPKKVNAVQQHEPTGMSKNRCDKSGTKHIDVSYVNPALKNWHDESEQEFGIDAPKSGNKSAKNKVQTQHAIEEKISYLRYLAKRKKVDESELWNNILDQAKRHIKSNDDTVSIQLPHLVNGPKLSELELTLTKLKEIVKKCRNVKKVQSGYSLDFNYRSSVECFKPWSKNRRYDKEKS